VWIYPDLLSTYGDQGNALVVERRLPVADDEDRVAGQPCAVDVPQPGFEDRLPARRRRS
jgi:hypothetical protein